MPKTCPPYAPEFRRQMIELVRAGRDPADLARELEPIGVPPHVATAREAVAWTFEKSEAAYQPVLET